MRITILGIIVGVGVIVGIAINPLVGVFTVLLGIGRVRG